MTGPLDRLLRLDSLRLGQEGVEFAFERPLPEWGWAIAAIAAGMLAWWSYRRLEGPTWWRAFLGSARALLLILLVLLIAGPKLTRQNEIEEPDWVLVMLDRSASMTIPDAPTPGADPADPDTQRITREQQLREAIEASAQTWRELADQRTVLWLGFDGGAYDLPERAGAWEDGRIGVELAQPVGRRTTIGRALEQALRRAAARPLSGVVVISDGRSLDEPTRSTLRRLQAERIPVFTLPLGSDEPLQDLAVRRADAPPVAFTDDIVPVEVEIERIGGPPDQPHGATVRLVDTATDAVLDERRYDADEPLQRLTLSAVSSEPGRAQWEVRIEPDGPDLIEQNNSMQLAVELVDRPLRVVYFDGYPRWEQRYLKNILLRERSVSSSSLILSPGRRFLQEGDVILDAIPTSPGQWGDFDVIILGDLRAESFSSRQLEQIREQVATRGTGLIWIAGEGPTPQGWRGSPLEDLLPFRLTERPDAPISAWQDEVTMTPTAQAERLGVLRLADPDRDGAWWPPALSDPATGWSRLRWAHRIDPALLKPAAEVLALAVPVYDTADPAPLVVSMRYGAGRVLYVGTDEIWRWRYGRGEFLPERFWVQMIRLLGRESLARTGVPARLETSPRRAEADQPVRIAVELFDQLLIDSAQPDLTVSIQRTADPRGFAVDDPDQPTPDPEPPITLQLRPERRPGPGVEQADAARTFAATWLPVQSGLYRIEVTDPALAAADLQTEVEIWLPDDELRRPETDHALLARLSEETGGAILTPDQLRELPELLPNRRLRILAPPDEHPLWDTPLALLLVITLLTAEWVGRRLIRLV